MTSSSPHQTTDALVSTVILAGGRGTRIGGEDKGLLPLNGRLLVEHLCDILAPQCTQLMISANRNIERYQSLGYPVIPDDLKGCGPLAGMLTALKVCNTPYLVCSPVDTPLIPHDYVARLMAGLHNASACVVMVKDHMQPLHLVLKSSTRPSLAEYLQQGGRRAGDWVRALNPALADFSDCPECFWNVNTPQEQARIQDHLQASRV